MQRNEEQNGRMQLKCIDRTQPLEVTAEIVLPDYRSEISRLLWVRPVFLPAAKFVGGGKIELSGSVCYHILYTAPDGELYGAEHEGSYAFSVPREGADGFDLGDGIELSVELIPDAVISRVQGPRKLSVRCRLRTRVQAYASKSMTPHFHGSVEDAERILRLCDAAENSRFLAGDPELVPLAGEIGIEALEGEPRLVKANGRLLITDATADRDVVRCRGEVLVTLLYCREGEEGGTPFSALGRIPFERELSVIGVMPDWSALVTGEVGRIQVTLEGESVSLTGELTLQAQAQCVESVLLHRDVFLPGAHSECHSEEERLWVGGICANRHFSVMGERPYSEIGLPADAELLCTEADAEIKERQSENGRTVLLGELRCHTLYRRMGDCETSEFSIPFRGILEEACDDMGVFCHAVSCRVTHTTEGVRVDAEIALAVRAYQEHTSRVLSEASFLAAEPLERADMELCYPAPGDSLWTVSKRYGVSPDLVASVNGLAADGYGDATLLKDAKFLLIP